MHSNPRVAFPLPSLAAAFLVLITTVQAAPDRFPGTDPLEWPEADLSERMMDGAHRFVERQIETAARLRARYWPRHDQATAGAESSHDDHRRRLREILGAVDSRLPPRMERYGDEDAPALVAESTRLRVHQVRWHPLEGVEALGLLAEPGGTPRAYVVALPDADQTPEQILGLAPGLPTERQWARRLAENGIETLVPVLVSRQPLTTSDPRIRASNQTDREWIHRQAFHLGRHIIGLEVQKVLSGVDWFEKRHGPDARIGVAGFGEGALIAFYAAALDPRVDAALVSGTFSPRERVWAEPIYRNVWGLLKRFGDAEIASLILPRPLVIEHSATPAIRDHKGAWQTPDSAAVRSEFDRLSLLGDATHASLVMGEGDAPAPAGSLPALLAFAKALGHSGELSLAPSDPADRRQGFDADQRRREVVTNLERYVQLLVQQADQVRDRAFLHGVMPELKAWRWSREKSLPTHDPAPFIAAAREYRERFATEGLGRFDEAPLPLRPRTRLFREAERWTAYDVVRDVWPEVFAWGILVMPKDIQPGERRPVVVCQHGRNGLPQVTLDPEDPGYNQVAARLADQGFITFAPHNLYRGEDRYRWLDRKANAVEATLFSFILAQHDAILRWLNLLPQVDGTRIGFYGLSYGGETAMRIPPVLEGYALSICSGDFNQWTRKVASTDLDFGFMRTEEWEMPYWNCGHQFDYAELACLMIPRPFMVERGHLDAVGRDAWVAHEYAKVRWLYAQLGLADRTTIEFFQGGHSLNCEGTFRFLQTHLDWPPHPTP